jgi:hypothetical protein
MMKKNPSQSGVKTMNTHTRPLFLVFTMLVAAALACSVFTGKSKTQEPAATQPGEIEITDTIETVGEATQPAGVSPTESEVEAEAGESGDLPDLSQGLGNLPSYRASFNIAILAKDQDGNPTSNTVQITQETVNTDNSQHTLLIFSGSLVGGTDSEGKYEVYQIEGMSYLVSFDDPANPQCSTFAAGASPIKDALLDPKDVIGKMENAKLVKKGESVNGIKTNHYTYDETNLSGSQFTKAKGDVWVAQEGNYVVKLTGTATGLSLVQVKDANATATFDYAIDQVGKVAKIKAPEFCGSLPADIPLPPNTKVELAIGEIYTLRSTDSSKDVADFYRSQLPNNGWTLGEDNTIGEMVTLHFTKDTRSLDIIINSDNGSTTIMISETK